MPDSPTALGEIEPRRGGTPLPAIRAVDAATQLVWRVLGPFPGRVAPVLSWLADGDEGAARSGWSRNQVAYRVQIVRRVGVSTPVRSEVTVELVVRGDPQAQRICRLLGRRPRWVDAGRLTKLSQRVLFNAALADRILAAVGPLPVVQLWPMVNRVHVYSHTPMPSPEELAAGLASRGASLDRDTQSWSASAQAHVPPRYAALLQAAEPGRVYRWSELAGLLSSAGYARSSSRFSTPGYHPLIHRLGRDRYVIGRPPTVRQLPASRWSLDG